MIPDSWLKERLQTTNMQELSKRELMTIGFSGLELQRMVARGPSPEWRKKWRAFINQMESGDELWFYESPPETWLQFSGAAGYAIVRAGQIIDSLRSRVS